MMQYKIETRDYANWVLFGRETENVSWLQLATYKSQEEAQRVMLHMPSSMRGVLQLVENGGKRTVYRFYGENLIEGQLAGDIVLTKSMPIEVYTDPDLWYTTIEDAAQAFVNDRINTLQSQLCNKLRPHKLQVAIPCAGVTKC